MVPECPLALVPKPVFSIFSRNSPKGEGAYQNALKTAIRGQEEIMAWLISNALQQHSES